MGYDWGIIAQNASPARFGHAEQPKTCHWHVPGMLGSQKRDIRKPSHGFPDIPLLFLYIDVILKIISPFNGNIPGHLFHRLRCFLGELEFQNPVLKGCLHILLL